MYPLTSVFTIADERGYNTGTKVDCQIDVSRRGGVIWNRIAFETPDTL
jgi:hypothetical protein